MRKLYASFAALIAATGLFAQQTPADKNVPFYAEPACRHEQHNATREPAAPTVQYYNDVIIQNAPAFDQRRVRLTVAFNGWLYAAYSTIDTTNGDGGITIRSSRDNGATWTTLDAYSVAGVQYPAFDIVVAGTDTINLTLYLAGINYNTSSTNYVLFVDRYNATTGAFVGSNFNQQNGTRRIYDVSLASDYRNPGVGASPYSIGILYSTYSPSFDSIVFVGSIDGGSSWAVRQPVATTGNYNRKVSLAYGRSSSASNGRYFAAWEQLSASNARVGHIFTSRCQSTVDGTWIPKVCLDSVSSSMINLCCNPEIAVQYNGTDNDSGSCTAVVLCQRDYYGNGSDFDLLGFYNKRSHYTNFWNRLDINNSGENDLQPDVTYDPGANNFLAVYYDSTNSKLPYIVNGMNLATPSAWTMINSQYNDLTTNLAAAYPRVEINPMVTQAAHVWNAEGAGGNGVAMFDAEYVVASVHNDVAASISGLFPNPSSSQFTLNYSLNNESATVITVYNMLGEVVESRTPLTTGQGAYTEQFDVSSWSNGVYTVTITNNGHVSSARVVVSHQ